jgi:hypothetical protein
MGRARPDVGRISTSPRNRCCWYPIQSCARCQTTRDVYRARINPPERSRNRLGTNDRTVATWRVEIQSDTNPNHAASRDHYARLTASDTPINPFGMLVLVETDSGDVLIHVIDGSTAPPCGTITATAGTYPIQVNVIVHHRLGPSF